jgi:hypothetical protein
MVVQFWKLASLGSLLNMQMLVRMVEAGKSGGGGGGVRGGDEYCLKKRDGIKW